MSDDDNARRDELIVVPHPWIVRLTPPTRPPVRRLLCVPYAGGGVAAFARWPAALPRDTEVLAVQLPAREGRIQERPITDMALIAGAIAAELEAMAPVPLVIFAYSVGAR